MHWLDDAQHATQCQSHAVLLVIRCNPSSPGSPALSGVEAVELAEARAERSMRRLASMLDPDGGLADASFAGAIITHG